MMTPAHHWFLADICWSSNMQAIGACHSCGDSNYWLEMTFATNQPAFDRAVGVCIAMHGAARRYGPDVSPIWTLSGRGPASRGLMRHPVGAALPDRPQDRPQSLEHCNVSSAEENDCLPKIVGGDRAWCLEWWAHTCCG